MTFALPLSGPSSADARSLPLELHDFVWEVLSNGTTPLAGHLPPEHAPRKASLGAWVGNWGGAVRRV
jgi:hypothetical protein